MPVEYETEIVYYFENLIDDFNIDNVSNFLKSIWLISDENELEYKSFEKLIYLEGDRQAVYTAKERKLISSITNNVLFTSFKKYYRHKALDCRIVVANINDSVDLIYECVKVMKLFNKAMDGLNIFMFVCSKGVFIGSSCLSNNTLHNCLLSPLITPNINWDVFYECLLYTKDSSDLLTFYHGVIDFIDSIEDCLLEDEAADSYNIEYYDDYKYVDPYYNYIDDSNTILNHQCGIYENDTVEESFNEIMSELDFIKPNSVNSLELLLEAENESQTNLDDDQHDFSQDYNTENIYIKSEYNDVMDNPIELMKKIKQDKGL